MFLSCTTLFSKGWQSGAFENPSVPLYELSINVGTLPSPFSWDDALLNSNVYSLTISEFWTIDAKFDPDVTDNDKVSFELEKGQKGMNAVQVKKV